MARAKRTKSKSTPTSRRRRRRSGVGGGGAPPPEHGGVSASAFPSDTASGDNPAPDAATRVLFLHGLESSPCGRKAKYLERHFAHVRCVDLQTSMWKISRQNCFLRFAFDQPEMQVISMLLLAAGWLFNAGYTWTALLVAVTAAAIARLRWQYCVSKMVHTVTLRCLDLVRDAVNEFQPDVICGSSYGGAVAMFSMLRQDWTGRTVLLASAHRAVNRLMVFHWRGPHDIPEEARIVLIHGLRDTTIPIEDSRALARGAPEDKVRLHEVDDHHRLRSLIGLAPSGVPPSKVTLRDAINEVVAM